ncbi:MAG TPA: VOC family protein [Gaiellaceae bacterium]|nr:VOC family protein [Gaiellaceae bacterium]
MRPRTLDHVAYWLADRDAIAEFAAAYLGMHVIDRTDRFTLVGADARRGKLTLFSAEGPREQGALEHVAFRVAALAPALERLPAGLAVDRPRDGEAYVDLAEGVRLGFVEADTDLDYDLDHVALRSADPQAVAAAYLPLGFAAAAPGPSGAPRVEVGGAWIEFQPGDPGVPERPLLNHVAVLVDSVDEHLDAARELGIEVDDVVDAPNTIAAFLRAPEHVRVEYVEHKPTFSLT